MNRCDICNKGSLIGHNVSHSKRRTIMRQQPNLHRVTLNILGKKSRLKLCSSCLRTEQGKIRKHDEAVKAKAEVKS